MCSACYKPVWNYSQNYFCFLSECKAIQFKRGKEKENMQWSVKPPQNRNHSTPQILIYIYTLSLHNKKVTEVPFKLQVCNFSNEREEVSIPRIYKAIKSSWNISAIIPQVTEEDKLIQWVVIHQFRNVTGGICHTNFTLSFKEWHRPVLLIFLATVRILPSQQHQWQHGRPVLVPLK